MFEPEFQVIVDSLVGDLAEQCKVRNTNFLLLRRLKHGLLYLRLPPALSPITHIRGALGAAKASTFLLPAERTSRVPLERIANQY